MYRFVTTMLFAGVGALSLSACNQGHHAAAPPPPAIYVAKQACEIDALAKERDTFLERVGHGHVIKDTEKTSTILESKLRRYRAEIEASYRFVTSNCNNYNLCMQANGFNENSCTQSRVAWTTSHQKFNDLAEDLNKRKWDGPELPYPPPGGHDPCRCDGPFATGDCCYDGD